MKIIFAAAAFLFAVGLAATQVEHDGGQGLRSGLHYLSSALSDIKGSDSREPIRSGGRHMPTITVSTSAQLLGALAGAAAGDTIELQPGTYSGIVVNNLNFAGNVRITSADPAQPAKLMDLMVKFSSGLTFSNLEFDASTATASSTFQVLDSQHVTINQVYVHGSLDGNPANDMSPVMVRNSSDVTIANSEFEECWHAINFLDSDHLTIIGSSFHKMRTDGIRGGGTSNVVIRGNSFTDFFPDPADHPDAIQFWTTNTTVAAHDILIADNVITRGSGAPMQGIFLRDQVGGLPFDKVTITGNMLVGTLWNGIDIQGGTNAFVANNVVASLPDQKSWIRMEDVHGGVLQHNRAGDYIQINNSNVKSTDFGIFLPTTTTAGHVLDDWLTSHGHGSPVGKGGLKSPPDPPTPPSETSATPPVTGIVSSNDTTTASPDGSSQTGNDSVAQSRGGAATPPLHAYAQFREQQDLHIQPHSADDRVHSSWIQAIAADSAFDSHALDAHIVTTLFV